MSSEVKVSWLLKILFSVEYLILTNVTFYNRLDHLEISFIVNSWPRNKLLMTQLKRKTLSENLSASVLSMAIVS